MYLHFDYSLSHEVRYGIFHLEYFVALKKFHILENFRVGMINLYSFHFINKEN